MISSAKIGGYNSAKIVALVGIMAATVECGKLALSFIPNVEVVTLLLAVYGYVFGWAGVIAAVVFVGIEPMIWGFGSWVVTYFIYWPSLALVFCLLRRVKFRSRWFFTAVAALMTVIFGILSTIVDVLFLTGITSYFFKNLIIFYARGIVFYVVQISCNLVLFPILFEFLTKKLDIIKRRMLL